MRGLPPCPWLPQQRCGALCARTWWHCIPLRALLPAMAAAEASSAAGHARPSLAECSPACRTRALAGPLHSPAPGGE
eukprot:2739514-Amphidinium_carterae.1